MEVVVASHRSSLDHDTGPNHPERPERVEAVLSGIGSSGLPVIDLEAPAASSSDLALVHEPGYVEMIERVCMDGGGALDMDTFVSAQSWEAALHAVGGMLALVETLETRTDAVGFAVTRPPGHHALPARAMGFCLFNNVAIAAAHLRARGDRVAILDWDVHHGNGTQTMLGDDPGTLYVSIHQDHFYPFQGSISDIEHGEAKGTVINVPIPANTAGDIYRRAWDEIVIPVTAQFSPDWVLVSAGFDAHIDDPLADLRLQASDYGWMAHRLAEVHPSQRTIVALEGGYSLSALHDSTAASLLGFAGTVSDETGGLSSPERSSAALSPVRDAVARYWTL